ncbi:InlB B-repeat-containing protein [Paratractidigestivibacter sp.]|uniref:InlB B-repeat-containing protein n=1 Tax=Paratractidigestivibacter sp. TaxID=2847316 RepID=UPI003AB83CAA
MKMNRTSAAAAVIAAGLVASLGALAPATVNADELTAAAPAATQSADAEDPAADVADDAAADADAAPSDDAAVSAVSAVALSSESTVAAPEAKAPAATMVAEFNGTQYASFDEALAAARDTDNATIKLLADAETAGLNLSKNLTIDGNGHALNFTDKGIALWGKALTFKNVNVTMTGIGSTPYTAGWNWVSVCASKDASLTLDGATLTMDGAGAGNVHAIYFCSNNKLNLKNASNLTIKNYKQDALEWDGGDGGYNVNIEEGSTYNSDHCRSGFTGTFIVTVDNSKVNVVNSTGNGSNGSHFNIVNGSVVDFSGNGSHGLSAGNLTIKNSEVTAKNNGLTGIIFTGKGEFKSANVQISGTKGKSYWNAGMRLMKSNATLDVDAASSISITGNKVTGLFLDAGAQATFAEGSDLRVTGNDASAENASTKMDLAKMDGGVVVRANASLTLPDSAVIENNNAALAGDDVYVERGGKITIGNTHKDILAGFGGCSHTIDGWYVDGKDSRWSAHKEPKFTALTQRGTYEGEVALKAAHGLVSVNYQYVGDAPANAKLPDGDEGLEVGSSYTAQTQNPVEGYTFAGWFTDDACTTQWVDGTPLTGSMTLYGKWTKNPETPATPAETQKPTTNKPAKKQVKKSVPKTGDETSSALPFALFGGAAAAIGLGIKSRRHE